MAMCAMEYLTLFEQRQAVLNGHFELRSGLHSDTYCQCAVIQQDPVLESDLCRALVEKMRCSMDWLDVDSVIAPAMGGITIGHEVARHLKKRFIFAEKEEGRLVLRRGFRIEKGERFVVAEDVVTRGGRVQETIDIIESRGGVVAAVLVYLDRSGGTFRPAAPLFSLIAMTPVVWEPAECPLCREGLPLEHPGSR